MLEPFLTRADITIVRFGPVGEPGVFGVGNRSVRVTSNLTAPYHQLNLLAALLAADALGLPIEDGEVEVNSRDRGQEACAAGRRRPHRRHLQREPGLASRRAGAPHRAGSRRADGRRDRRDGGAGAGCTSVPRGGRAAEIAFDRVVSVGGALARYAADERTGSVDDAVSARPRRARARGRGAREGVAGGGSRSARGGARPSWSRRLVVRVLLAVIVAMVISIVVGPKFIEFLRARELGQHIREEKPADRQPKQGTPVMGGVLILIAPRSPSSL